MIFESSLIRDYRDGDLRVLCLRLNAEQSSLWPSAAESVRLQRIEPSHRNPRSGPLVTAVRTECALGSLRLWIPGLVPGLDLVGGRDLVAVEVDEPLPEPPPPKLSPEEERTLDAIAARIREVERLAEIEPDRVGALLGRLARLVKGTR